MKNRQDIWVDLRDNIPLQATNESGYSNLPGKDGGPYDAYRHILWTAEMTRRYGENTARSIASAHELEGDVKGQEPVRRAMDEHNNELGYEIGRNAGSWEEVVREARNTIDASVGRNGPALWLPEDQWRHSDNNPNPAPLDRNNVPLPPEHWNWPVPRWPEDAFPLHPFVPTPPHGNSLRGLSFWDLEGWGSVHPYGIDPAVHEAFQDAVAYRPPYTDPLAIDLDGDGIETVGITQAPVLFDHNGDGQATFTGWLSGDDAWLVLDRNGNGLIESGAELFGTDTLKRDGQLATSGLDALRELDGNGDGLLDARDEPFDQVQLWQDNNLDGVSQREELTSLADHGITAIDVFGAATDIDLGNGNRIAAASLVWRGDGSTTQVVDLMLASEPSQPESMPGSREAQATADAPPIEHLPDNGLATGAWNDPTVVSGITASVNDLWRAALGTRSTSSTPSTPAMGETNAFINAQLDELIHAMATTAPPSAGQITLPPDTRWATGSASPSLATPIA